MKKYLILLTVLCMAALLAFGVMADTAEDFAVAVLSANNVEQPEADVTKAELDAVVNRLSKTYNGTIGENDKNVGTSTTLVTRGAAVKALYDVVNGKADLTVKNEVLGMVDMDANDANFEACRAFLQAGIITGYNEYGAVGPDKNVKRYELAIMVDRILNPAERVAKNYVLYSSDEPFYLIDDLYMQVNKSLYNSVPGWRYDYTGSKEATKELSFTNKLTDFNVEDDISMFRYVNTQNSGVVVFESIYDIANGNTFHFEFNELDGDNVLSAGWRNGAPYISGVTEATGSGTIRTKNNTIRVEIDFDENTAKLWMNGSSTAVATTIPDGSNIAKVRLATDVATTGIIEFKSIQLYKNYEINDVFRLEEVGAAPVSYTSSGATVQSLQSNPQNHDENESLKITNGGYATRAVAKPVGGTIAASAHVYTKDGSTATFTLQTADGTVDLITAKAQNGVWYINDTQVATYNNAVWQQVRIEADLENKTATVRINGKDIREGAIAQGTKVLELPIKTFTIPVKAKDVTHVKLASVSGEVWFDDIKLHQTKAHEDDYVPEPVPITPDNGLVLSMSSCNLWRNGSHYGWDLIAPYPEYEPITGFYDEGSPEAMDWEIKFLTEHGITNYALCWYPNNTPGSDPLKKSRMNEALNDGYFNAKYADMMTFNLMFENSGFTDLEEFQNVIWPYMIEWYFKDPRYLTISKGNGTSEIVFTVYRIDSWLEMCGGKFTYSEGVSSTSTAGNAASVLSTMESTLAAANIIDKNGDKVTGIVFNMGGSMYHEGYEGHALSGAENIILYAWGKGSNIAGNYDNQVEYATLNQKGAYNDGMNLVALPAAAFNDMPWSDIRTDTMTGEQFEQMCIWYRDTFLKSSNKRGSMTNFVQFDTWNEFGEGHYFYPTVDRSGDSNYDMVGTGFDYLDAIANVFCSGHDSSNDVAPNDTQKARINNIFHTNNATFMARENLPSTTTLSYKGLLKTGATFTSSNMDGYMNIAGHKDTFGSNNNFERVAGNTWTPQFYHFSNDAIHLKETSSSNGVINFDANAFSIDTSVVDYVCIRAKASSGRVSAKLYYDTDESFGEDKVISFMLPADGSAVYIEKTRLPNWTGTYTHLRLDIYAPGADIYLYEISFNQFDPAYMDSIVIDNIAYTPKDYNEIRTNGVTQSGSHEVYVAAQQWNGLYAKLHTMNEYNRESGEVFFEGPSGKKMKFTVGSSTAVVTDTSGNTSNVSLSQAVATYDGVPEIPLFVLMDNLDIDYTRSGRTINVSVANAYKVVYDVANGNAESETPMFTGAYGGTSTIVTRENLPAQLSNGGSKAWFIEGTSTNEYKNLEFAYDWEVGVSYTIDFDIYVVGFGVTDTDGNISKPTVSATDTRTVVTPGIAVRSVNPAGEKGVGSAPRVDEYGKWQHITYTFTPQIPFTNGTSEIGTKRIGIFFEGQSAGSIECYIDNIVIS